MHPVTGGAVRHRLVAGTAGQAVKAVLERGDHVRVEIELLTDPQVAVTALAGHLRHVAREDRRAHLLVPQDAVLAVAVGAHGRLADSPRRRPPVDALGVDRENSSVALTAGLGHAPAIHLRPRVGGRQDGVGAMAGAASRRLLALPQGSGVNAGRVGAQRLGDLQASARHHLRVGVALAAGVRQAFWSDRGRGVAARRQGVHRAVTARAVDGPRLLALSRLAVHAAGELLDSVGVTVGAGIPGVAGLVRDLLLAGVATVAG